MAYIETIKLVTGDTLPDLSFTLKNSNTAAAGKNYDANDSSTWEPINLTSSSLKLYIREIGDSTILKTLSGIVSNATEGKVIFSFANNAFENDGIYEGEVEITYEDGGVQSMYDLVKFKVRSDFD